MPISSSSNSSNNSNTLSAATVPQHGPRRKHARNGSSREEAKDGTTRGRELAMTSLYGDTRGTRHR